MISSILALVLPCSVITPLPIVHNFNHLRTDFAVFSCFYCYNGLLRERQFELVGYAVGVAIILLYVIINYCMTGTEGDYAKLVSLFKLTL